MDTHVFDIVIIGGGLTGLNLASCLKKFNPSLKIVLLEKSKSCGGRMATRRVGDSKFDHGAQFLNQTEHSAVLYQDWTDHQVGAEILHHNESVLYGVSGMTSLSKFLSKNLDIRYLSKVIKIERHALGFTCSCENERIFKGAHVVLTSPLPQACDLLTSSQFKLDPVLINIEYAKSIVFLVTLKNKIDFISFYKEHLNLHIFSICSQQAKGLSSEYSYVVAMTEVWSDTHFAQSDEDIIIEGKKEIETFLSQTPSYLELKKWRFCHPKEVYKSPFFSLLEGLYIAGDAFGGPDLNGALRSSHALFQELSCNLRN